MKSFLVAILLCAAPLHAHGDDPRFHVELPLSSEQVTGHRGHTISLNLKQPVRDLERYFLYHELFDEVHRQGTLRSGAPS